MSVHSRNFQSLVRRAMLDAATPAVKIAAHMTLPIPAKCRLLTEKEKLAVLETALPGDIILTRTRGRLTNQLIPGGFFKHIAMFSCNRGMIIEASPPVMQLITVEKFLENKDYFAHLRSNVVEKLDADIAAHILLGLQGTPYDYRFEPGVGMMYCSDAVAWAFSQVTAKPVCTPAMLLGVETYLPHHFWNDLRWDVVNRSASTDGHV